MAYNLLVRNCNSGDTKAIDPFSTQLVALPWGGNAGQVSIAEVNYCPPGIVLTFKYNNADVYTYVTQGLSDSLGAFPMCSVSPNPDGSSYSGPIDQIIVDTSAVTYPINLDISPLAGIFSEWGVELTLTHDGDSSTEVYYTLDGSDPRTSTTRHMYDPGNKPWIGGGQIVNNLIYFKAVAVNPAHGTVSNALAETFIFSRPISLVSSVPHGYHIDKTPIELTATDPAGNTPTIFYTLDGSEPLDDMGDPTPQAIEYSGPITPPSNEFTLRAVAVLDWLLSESFSNEIRDYHKYEEDVLTLEATPSGGTFPDESLQVFLSTNELSAKINYTLDGSSPLAPTALLYTGPIPLIGTHDIDTFRLRAVAVSDRLISTPIDTQFTLYKYNSDADGDEISNGLEGGPDTDTDSDGIPDMLDADSDNDGMPDFIEGVADADGDNIPAFQDSDERLPFWYMLTGIPTDGDLVNGLQYEVKIQCYGDTGYLDIECDNPAIIFSEKSVSIPSGEEKIIYMYVPEVMENKCSPAWSGEAFDILFTVSHLVAGELVSESILRNYTIVPANAEVPYVGNLVTWTKLDGAKKYNIYRQNPDSDESELIASILHDSYHENIDTQQYLDRTGQMLSVYRVTGTDGVYETSLSNALHASDCVLDTCDIIGHISTPTGVALENIRVSARIDKAPVMQRNIHIDAFESHVYSDAYGQFVLRLPKGAECIIKIDQAALRKKVAIPYEDSIDFDELIRLNEGG